MEEVAFKRAFKKSMGFSHKENQENSHNVSRGKRQKARIMYRTELMILKKKTEEVAWTWSSGPNTENPGTT